MFVCCLPTQIFQSGSVILKKTLFLGKIVINRSKRKMFFSKVAKKILLGRGQNGGSVGKQQTKHFLRSAQGKQKFYLFIKYECHPINSENLFI